MEKEFELKDLANDNSKICMAARITEDGGAEAIVHGTDESEEAVYKLVILFALLLESLEQKTGYDGGVLYNAAITYLNQNRKGHNKGCIDHIDTGF